jgi:hypothetical protein
MYLELIINEATNQNMHEKESNQLRMNKVKKKKKASHGTRGKRKKKRLKKQPDVYCGLFVFSVELFIGFIHVLDFTF